MSGILPVILLLGNHKLYNLVSKTPNGLWYFTTDTIIAKVQRLQAFEIPHGFWDVSTEAVYREMRDSKVLEIPDGKCYIAVDFGGLEIEKFKAGKIK